MLLLLLPFNFPTGINKVDLNFNVKKIVMCVTAGRVILTNNRFISESVMCDDAEDKRVVWAEMQI